MLAKPCRGEEWRDRRDWTERKYAMWPRNEKPRRARVRRPESKNAGSFVYLRTPDTRTVGTGTGIGEKAGLLGGAAAEPAVFLHVGTASVEPTEGHTYDPTEGCTTDPYPSVPVVCASASVLVRVNAVASAIVVTFMVVSFAPKIRTPRAACSAFPFNSSLA